MSLVTGFAVGVVIMLLSASAITAFGVYLRYRDSREQEPPERLHHG
jgi:hypothetical protein